MGFTLIEIMISILILGGGLLTLAIAFAQLLMSTSVPADCERKGLRGGGKRHFRLATPGSLPGLQIKT